MTTQRYTIGVPWEALVSRALNVQHPLPRSLIEDTPDFAFSAALQPRTADGRAAVARDAAALRGELRQLPVTGQDVDAFIESRSLDAQEMMAGPTDLLFLHTTPMTLGRHPWAIHIEATLPLFEPFFGHFRTQHIDLDATPAWHMVRHLMRAPACRAILTHVKRTADDLPKLLGDETLSRKIHYAPLGLELPAEIQHAAAAATARKDAKSGDDEIVLLFTNSWHQDPDSFVKRGGIEAVVGFLTLLRRQPNCRLILRTGLPSYLAPDLCDLVRHHPRIELHEQTISDAALYDLLFRADIFLLPSTHLHTISTLRAMATGAVVVTTDAPAIEEFITDGDNGLVVPAWKDVLYWEDRGRGLIREANASKRQPDGRLAANLVMTMERLIADRELRSRLRSNARHSIATRHGLDAWRHGFHAMLRAALAAPGGPVGTSD